MNMARVAPPAAPRTAAWEVVAGGLMLCTFIALRLPLWIGEGLIHGWNSDAAVLGLMARAMVEGSDFPLFFWGQQYLGTLTSMMTALVTVVGPDRAPGPLDLRVATAIQVAGSILLFWRGSRYMVGPRAAALATLWMVAGPAFVFEFTVAPIGAEQLLFASALMFFVGARAPLAGSRRWFIFGVVAGIGLWLHHFSIFMTAAVVAGARWERQNIWRGAMPASAGFLVGYAPAIAAYLMRDPVLYARARPGWGAHFWIGRVVDMVTEDLWNLLADSTPAGIIAAVVVLALTVWSLRVITWTRPVAIAVIAIFLSLVFSIVSTHTFRGSTRYIVPVVPLFYAFAAHGIIHLWSRGHGAKRASALFLALLVTAILIVGRASEAREYAAGKREQYLDWPGGVAPRPILAWLRAGGYSACYAEAWMAHKYEWISTPTVPMIAVRGVQRTLERSVRDMVRSGRKCYLTNEGEVRTLSVEEEGRLRGEVEVRARKAGIL